MEYVLFKFQLRFRRVRQGKLELCGGSFNCNLFVIFVFVVGITKSNRPDSDICMLFSTPTFPYCIVWVGAQSLFARGVRRSKQWRNYLDRAVSIATRIYSRQLEPTHTHTRAKRGQFERSHTPHPKWRVFSGRWQQYHAYWMRRRTGLAPNRSIRAAAIRKQWSHSHSA